MTLGEAQMCFIAWHMLLQLESLHHVWGHGSYPSAACGVVVVVSVVCRCHGHPFHTACGVVVMVSMVHGCCSHPFHATCGDTGPILLPCVVSWLRLSLSRHVWCHGHPFHAVCVVDAVHDIEQTQRVAKLEVKHKGNTSNLSNPTSM